MTAPPVARSTSDQARRSWHYEPRSPLGTVAVLAATLLGACIGVVPAPAHREGQGASPAARAPSGSGRVAYPTIATATLPSGLLVVLERDPYAKTVGVVSVVRGGSSTDPVGAEGVAHLVEHLTFRAVDPPEKPLPLAAPAGAPSAGATRRERLVHHAVVLVNGLTSPDAVVFFAVAPPQRLPWLIDLEAARLADPLAGIDEAAVELERRTIASEHELLDDPRSGKWASRQVFTSLFPAGHPYARPVDGTAKSRGRLTLAEARDYAAANFRPERMTLVVTGPPLAITLEAIIERLPKKLVGESSRRVPRAVPAETTELVPVEEGPLVRRASPLPTPQLWLGWSLPGWWGAHGPQEMLLARWVEQDLALDYLRQEDPHIRHVRTFLLPGAKATALLVRVLVDDSADPERTRQVVAGRVESLWTREPAQRGVLERLKAQFDTELVLDSAPRWERTVAQAELAAMGSAPQLHAERMAQVRKVVPAELAKYAYKHLAKDRHRAVYYTPADIVDARQGRPDEGDRARSEKLFSEAASWQALELPEVPRPVDKIEVTKLRSGLTVIVARRRGPSALAWLGFHGGYVDANPPLLLELAIRTRPDALDLAKHRAISDRGATLDASIDILEFRPADLPAALDVLFKKATMAVQKWPPREDLDRMLAHINADLDSASEQASQRFAKTLFGRHPLSRLVLKSDLPRITRSDVDSWVGRVHNLTNAALVVVGDVDTAEVTRLAGMVSHKTGSRSWLEPTPPVPPLPFSRGPQAPKTAITSRSGSLTDLRVGCLLPAMQTGERPAYELLRLAVQERLSSALRFERGAGYGVNATVHFARGGIAFLDIGTHVNVQRLPDALSTLRTHWRRWSASGFDAGEMNVARWLWTGQIALTSSTGSSVAYRLFSEWNLDPEGLTTSLGRSAFSTDVTSIDAARLNQLFATCASNTVLSLTGHEPSIRQALRRAWPEAQPSSGP